MLSELRVRAGGALISSLLNTTMRGMRLHPQAWSIGRGIEVTRNIPYTDAGDPAQRLDVYRPTNAKGPLPIFLYIHGGGFRILSKDTHWMMNYKFAQHGLVVFSINYRLVPSGAYPNALKDVMAAVKWISAHAADFGADPTQWYIGGESAGGNLTLALTLAACERRQEPWAAEIYDLNLPIKAILPACGILQVSDGERFKRRKQTLPTLLADRVSSVCSEYLGSDENRGSLADPLLILESDWAPTRPFPPTMSLVGTRDPILDDTRRLGAALKRRGVEHEIKIYPGGIHGFHVVFWSDRGRAAWDAQLAFLDRFLVRGETS